MELKSTLNTKLNNSGGNTIAMYRFDFKKSFTMQFLMIVKIGIKFNKLINKANR